MEFGTVVLWAFLLLLVGFFIWFCVGLVKLFFHMIFGGQSTPRARAAEYPDGADEPDGSSYSVVNGEVRLE